MRFSSHSKRRSLAAAAAGAALIAAGLTGCSGDGGSGDGGSATSGEITWWSWTPDNNVAEAEIAAFNNDYPDIKVNYRKVPIDNYAAILRPALASNDGPDVFSVNATGSFSAQTFAPYATDLTPAIEKLLGDDWKSKVFDGGTKAFTIDDRLVAGQWARVGAGIMWINKDTFDKYKVQPPKTYDDWVSVCKTFRDNGLGCFREGMAGSAGFIVDTMHSIVDSVEPHLWARALAGEAKWNDPGFVEAFGILRKMQADGILDKGSVGYMQYPDVNNAFLSGDVPMVQMGTWYAQYAVKKNLAAALEGAGETGGDQLVQVPIPFPDVAGKGNPSTIFSDVDAGHSVNAKSPNRNAATTFALWMGHTQKGQEAVVSNLDAVATLKGVSPDFDSIDLVDPEVQRPELEQLASALDEKLDPRYGTTLTAELSQAVIDASQAMVNGNRSPQDVANDLQSVADSQG
ncbi:ABC transporter substrate-binding protein [Amnibacterium endophyticum]|uniref:ABC transporter substrate-binding protein n=1 Tax=Amnibacterium endophyticum TaxID=2109337 RepID=A0ABW4LE71_9MICO